MAPSPAWSIHKPWPGSHSLHGYPCLHVQLIFARVPPCSIQPINVTCASHKSGALCAQLRPQGVVCIPFSCLVTSLQQCSHTGIPNHTCAHTCMSLLHSTCFSLLPARWLWEWDQGPHGLTTQVDHPLPCLPWLAALRVPQLELCSGQCISWRTLIQPQPPTPRWLPEADLTWLLAPFGIPQGLVK
jgi:hypothetical protein